MKTVVSSSSSRTGQLVSQGPKVVLLFMPWATTTRPSLALGILASICHEEGVLVRTLYPNMDISAMIGFEAAGQLANQRCLYGLSEHLFACDLFGAEILDSDELIETLVRFDLPDPFKEPGYLKYLRDEVIDAFLHRTVQRVLEEAPTAVGFSATFNQVMASLALAKRLKQQRPELQILAGGACFDEGMGQEYHRALPDVLDHMFIGEAEESFRQYLRHHAAGQPTDNIPGVTAHENGRLLLSPGRPLPDMSLSPMPDYDDFFVEKERLFRETGRVFNIEFLPIESSRGCWWGNKSQCLFCGLNEASMVFREKDVDRVVEEMVTLTARYRVVNLTASDWIISHRSRRILFQKLKELDLDLECFYETRADLSKEEIALMRDAGVVKVQPGIESFSTELLRLMGKGTTNIRHIQFMRWCREYGIHLSYNILAGFPGEKAEWYLEMAGFLPRIHHLQPPLHNMHFVEMHRYSRLYECRDQFGVDEYQAREDYGFNFPQGFIDTNKIGYFFSYHSTMLADPKTFADRLRDAVAAWMDAHKTSTPPEYYYRLGPGFLSIVDTRHGKGRYLQLADLHHDVLLLCDEIQSVSRLKQLLAPRYPEAMANGDLERVVEQMVDEDLLLQEGNALLALPIGYRPRTTAELTSYVLA